MKKILSILILFLFTVVLNNSVETFSKYSKIKNVHRDFLKPYDLKFSVQKKR